MRYQEEREPSELPLQHQDSHPSPSALPAGDTPLTRPERVVAAVVQAPDVQAIEVQNQQAGAADAEDEANLIN